MENRFFSGILPAMIICSKEPVLETKSENSVFKLPKLDQRKFHKINRKSFEHQMKINNFLKPPSLVDGKSIFLQNFTGDDYLQL
jgi:hypothetical protein